MRKSALVNAISMLAILLLLVVAPNKAEAVVGDVTLSGLPPNTTISFTNEATGQKEEKKTDDKGGVIFFLGDKNWGAGSYTVTATNPSLFPGSPSRSIQVSDGNSTHDLSGLVPFVSGLARPIMGGQFFRYHVGPSFNQNSDVNLKFSDGTINLKSVRFATGWSTGGTVGYWPGIFPYAGFGLDVSYNENNINMQMIDACFRDFCQPNAQLGTVRQWTVVVTPALYGRYPVPFVGDGRTLWLQGSVGPAISTATINGGGFSDQKLTDTTVGVKAGLGLNYRVTPNIGLYLGYDFMHVDHEFSFTESGSMTSQKIKVQVPWNVNSVQFGASYMFCWFDCPRPAAGP